MTDELHCDILANDTVRYGGRTVKSDAPILDLCRALIRGGVDPDTPLVAMRDGRPAVIVRSIGNGARFTVRDGISGKPKFVRWRPFDRSRFTEAADEETPPSHG